MAFKRFKVTIGRHFILKEKIEESVGVGFLVIFLD